MTTALVTGITGQDGSLLAELLVSEGVSVVGLSHSAADPHDVPNLAAVADAVTLVAGDLSDFASLRAAVAEVEPDELYHLAAPTFVPASWDDPEGTFAQIAGATGALLEAAARQDGVRVVVTASSEVFGDAGESPQNERSPMRPRTPYGAAKLEALQLVRAFRARGDVQASAAITYNHESERRPERFVTRKVTKAVAEIKLGVRDEVVLGALDAVRDWSAARDVVGALRLMAAQDEPGDYVLASGRGRTVGELVETAFAAAGLRGEDHVRVDPELVRAPEATPPVGDPSLAGERLGWAPRTSFEELIAGMVEADLRAAAPRS